MHSARTGVLLLEALVDLEGVGALVTRRNASHTDTANDRYVILSVDTVSFRPRVTIMNEADLHAKT
jgi:hypothetical protein